MIAIYLLGFALLASFVFIGWLAWVTAAAEKPHECEVCGRRLTDRQAVEITETYPEPDGGTSLTATFCKKDAPEPTRPTPTRRTNPSHMGKKGSSR